MRTRALITLIATACIAGPLAAQGSAVDEWQSRPVDDKTFHGFLQFFTYDRTLPFDVRAEETDDVEGVTREHLSFQSTPGQRITARIYRATGSVQDGRRWILLLHGGAQAGKDSPPIRLAGIFFARAGWNVLAMDMLHYGERKTDLVPVVTTPELLERLYSKPPIYLEWVSQTVKDAGRSFDYLVRERGADARKVVLVGVSRGAVAAMIVGGADARFVAVALLYGGHYLANETVPHLPASCPANFIGRISPRPVFMVNGTADNLFLRESSVMPLQRLLRDPKTVVWNETGHMGNIVGDFPQVVGWMRENVK